MAVSQARAPDPDRGQELADMLQFLVGNGDGEWVEEFIRMIRYRVQWVKERDKPNHPFSR